jgi:hypothetical protein
MERIAVLVEEIGALKASQVSFEEQVEKLVSDYRELDLKKQTYEAKRREALAQDRDIAAQKLGVEISFFAVELQDINMRIKDIQRQSYFLGLERNRKQRLRKRLEEEIEVSIKTAEFGLRFIYNLDLFIFYIILWLAICFAWRFSLPQLLIILWHSSDDVSFF